jgi:hypothetical protein
LVVCFDNKLHGDDRVGPGRHGASGRDLHRFARLQRPIGGQACRDPVNDGEAPREIARPDREAVHRRAGERRQVDLRGDVLRQHPAGCGADLDRLRVERARPGEHAREGVVDREQRGHRPHTLTA